MAISYCCEAMHRWSEPCAAHAHDPINCPDQLIAHLPASRVPGIRIHDGGTSLVVIAFCPWCGTRIHPEDGLPGKLLAGSSISRWATRHAPHFLKTQAMTDQNQTSHVRTLTWSEDGHFYAALPDFPGCIGDGPTLPEAIEDCRLASIEWLDEARRLGRMQ